MRHVQRPMNEEAAIAQALRYAEGLTELHRKERAERQRAERALAELERSYRATVVGLSAALELRDDDTGGHAERVAALALRLTAVVAPELVSDPQLEYGFLLHDIGKIGIPDAILRKPAPLDPAELALMRRHPALGQSIARNVPSLSGLPTQVILSHHERWDGGGYPEGLAGEQIPFAARIFALVDSFDAMTNDRPYRRRLPVEHALEEIRNGAGSQFDPHLAEAFPEVVNAVSDAA